MAQWCFACFDAAQTFVIKATKQSSQTGPVKGMRRMAWRMAARSAGGHRAQQMQSSSLGASSDMWASYTRCRPMLASAGCVRCAPSHH